MSEEKIVKTVVPNNENNSKPVAGNAQAAPAGERKPFERKFNGKRDDKRPFNKRPQKDKTFEEKVVKINRVTKVTKGGRRFRFAAVVVIGDKKGRVGVGTGKANEVPDAIKKAIKDAKKTLVRVPFDGTTVPHDALGHFGAGKVLIKPAKKGTGVIAGGPSRAVMELAGISDVYAKSLGSNTPINMIRATLDGLSQMMTRGQLESLRSNDKFIKKPIEKSEQKESVTN